MSTQTRSELPGFSPISSEKPLKTPRASSAKSPHHCRSNPYLPSLMPSVHCCNLKTFPSMLNPKPIMHNTLNKSEAIKKLFWLKSNRWGKKNPKNTEAERSGITLNSKAGYTAKNWLQNSLFRQDMHHSSILLNKLNTCKGEGETHTFLSTLK